MKIQNLKEYVLGVLVCIALYVVVNNYVKLLFFFLKTELCYDWIDDRLFWIDESTLSIKEYDMASSITTLLYGNLRNPDHLTFDPFNK